MVDTFWNSHTNIKSNDKQLQDPNSNNNITISNLTISTLSIERKNAQEAVRV